MLNSHVGEGPFNFVKTEGYWGAEGKRKIKG